MYKEMLPSFHANTYKSILSDINKKRVMVSVPMLAITGEKEIGGVEECTEFINGAPVINRRTMKTTHYDTAPVSYINGEPVKTSVNNRTTVMLPLTAIIDIYHNGFSIYLVRREDTLKLAEMLSELLDRLEVSPDKNKQDIFNYINDFYINVLKGKNKTLDKLINKEDSSLQEVVGFTEDLLSTKVTKADFINLKDISIN